MVASDATARTVAIVAPAFAATSNSARPASMVFASQTTGTFGNSFRSARTASSPAALRSGVPTSSRSAPPSSASRAHLSARAVSTKSRAAWSRGMGGTILPRAPRKRAEPGRVHAGLHRAPVEGQAARRLEVGAGARVHPRAVAVERLVRGEPPVAERAHGLVEGVRRGGVRGGRPVLAAHEHVADALLELAHVARPGVVGAEAPVDPGAHLGGEAGRLLAEGAADDLRDELREIRGVVVEALAERGHRHHVGADAEVEVVAEVAPSQQPGGVEARRGEELPGEGAAARLAHAGEGALVQHAEEAHLHARRERPD